MDNTVTRLSEPYENFLLRPPTAGPGVCATCWREVGSTTRCDRCREHLDLAGSVLAQVVVPISLAIRGKQFAHELWHYKDSRLLAVRNRIRLGLTAVTERFVATHEPCLATAAGVENFDLVTTVPSTGGRVDHPLALMVGKTMSTTRSRYRPVLRTGQDAAEGRKFSLDRFSATGRVDGSRILLVDDTWTTGANAQSAAAALRTAGAKTVAVLVLGRWFDADFRPGATAEYLGRAATRRFDWDLCCLCQPQPPLNSPPDTR
ncbi:hypothetical protein [Umezawaea sp. Da 62-37]|uniref:hypothetical protein n=1 Tax=Umezawaea sp. Da 62-37 TaxID=3075927 RepID=UPI0028F73BA9|nr:hypothetical protein [Umezawaea sp. Da 62-37]WNV91355.1 hypothetical protein RM788_24750 [Umezawaea sp. Da 62-37]